MLAVLRVKPWLLLALPVWLLQGKHRLKAELARRVELDFGALPYNEAVIDVITDARKHGRPVVLVTGSNRKFASQVQRHLGFFDHVLASDTDVNMTGKRKAKALNDLLGEGRYEYVANGFVDLHVWASAGAAVAVNPSDRLLARIAKLGKPQRTITSDKPALSSWLRAMRIHQWAKNALIFVPLITAHRVFDVNALAAALTAFVCFGLLASATYILNDLFDLESDRHHRTKKQRPFAAGTLSIQSGLVGAVTLLSSSAILAFVLPIGFQVSLLAYFVTTLSYSLRLKLIASADVMVLAALYTLRIIAGAFAIGAALSFWLLAFSLFVFLCLAFVKRVAELKELDREVKDENLRAQKLPGREYRADDIAILRTMGASSGYLSVLVLALYINSPDVALLYRTPQILWLITPLMLLWVTRLWVLTDRGQMHEDPIVFAIKDPETWLTAAGVAVILIVATLLDLHR
jgi:4-hydroxybenzoate polyprenyltransferase